MFRSTSRPQIWTSLLLWTDSKSREIFSSKFIGNFLKYWSFQGEVHRLTCQWDLPLQCCIEGNIWRIKAANIFDRMGFLSGYVSSVNLFTFWIEGVPRDQVIDNTLLEADRFKSVQLGHFLIYPAAKHVDRLEVRYNTDVEAEYQVISFQVGQFWKFFFLHFWLKNNRKDSSISRCWISRNTYYLHSLWVILRGSSHRTWLKRIQKCSGLLSTCSTRLRVWWQQSIQSGETCSPA